MAHNDRIAARFAALKKNKRSAFVTFITAGDPDLETSRKLIAQLPAAGVDLIEIGIPFTDPMADGPAIQNANLRALAAGTTLRSVLDLVRDFRSKNTETPLILMGYYNPIFVYGVSAFLKDAKDVGVDGLIIVDLPPEEDEEVCIPAEKAGIAFIRLVTPTTDDKRRPVVLRRATGFLYYVSIAGTTGTKEIDLTSVEKAVLSLRQHSDLPIVVGFGITTPDQAAKIAKIADGAVVGSAVVSRIEAGLDIKGKASDGLTEHVLTFVAELAKAVHQS